MVQTNTRLQTAEVLRCAQDDKRFCQDDKPVVFKESIALVGFMAAGKTTIGRRLAQRLGMPFVDLDRQIVQINGKLIPTIFKDNNESYFRQLEAIALRQVLKRRTPIVLATGGGTFAQPPLRALLCHHFQVVHLSPGGRCSTNACNCNGKHGPWAWPTTPRTIQLASISATKSARAATAAPTRRYTGGSPLWRR